MAKNDVVVRDVEVNMKDITSNMAVTTAMLKRKQYVSDELRRINQAMAGAATLTSKAVSFARKMGESTSTELLDRLDDKLCEIEEQEEECPEGERWCSREMKCIPDE